MKYKYENGGFDEMRIAARNLRAYAEASWVKPTLPKKVVRPNSRKS